MNNNLNADVQPGCRTRYSSNAPDYRASVPGLNLDALCEKCDKQVIVPVGFSEEEGFSLSSLLLLSACPLCRGTIPPAQVGCLWFSKCRYKMKFRSQEGAHSRAADTVEELLDYPLVVDANSAPASVIIKTFPLELSKGAMSMPPPRG